MLLYLLSSNRFDVTLLSSDGSTPLHYLIRSFPEPLASAEASAVDQESHPFTKFSNAVRQLILKGTTAKHCISAQTITHTGRFMYRS